MKYIETVLPVLKKTRSILLSEWGTIEIKDQKTASAVSVVTSLDEEVEKMVARDLEGLYPHITFVGEEFGGDRGVERFWMMDPIDGTSHFVRGLPFCTSMIALIEHGSVTFSVIYDFINDVAYWAERGAGAFRNNERIFVSKRELGQAYICYESDLKNEHNAEVHLALREKAVVFESINAGWEYAMVACGKLDARICLDPYGKDYDYAPGSLLVAEAGGIVRNITSDQYDFTNTSFIAANPLVYKELYTKEGIFHHFYGGSE